MLWRIVTYVRMTNAHAQRTRQTIAFAAARCDESAMRPLAKLLWTIDSQYRLFFLSIGIFRVSRPCDVSHCVEFYVRGH